MPDPGRRIRPIPRDRPWPHLDDPGHPVPPDEDWYYPGRSKPAVAPPFPGTPAKPGRAA